MIEFMIWLLAVTGSALVLTQSSITAPIRDGLDRLAKRSEAYFALTDPEAITPRMVRLVSKLVACPMCSGFWIGAAWYIALREAPIAWRSFGIDGLRDALWILAFGFAGSFASAVGVAGWLVLGEATATMGGWRYLNQPPANVHVSRYRIAMHHGVAPIVIRCPEPGCPACGGEDCKL